MTTAITPLCKLAYRYGTDKCPQLRHSYTPYYYELLNPHKKRIKKVLEMGIGYMPGMPEKKVVYDAGLKRNYHMGASLYMWRDFFPHAQIYGADDKPGTLFTDDRIQTFLCDERKEADIVNLIAQTGSDIDVFIDDGNHNRRRQVFLAKTALPLLKKDVLYIIEDVSSPYELVQDLAGYHCEIAPIIPQTHDDNLVIIRNTSSKHV